jgi:hypothetical protein
MVVYHAAPIKAIIDGAQHIQNSRKYTMNFHISSFLKLSLNERYIIILYLLSELQYSPAANTLSTYRI